MSSQSHPRDPHRTPAGRGARLARAGAVLAAAVAAPWPSVAAVAQDAAGTIAFVGVNVAPMDAERTIENQTVVVSDGRIAAMGPVDDIPVPEGATVVEGRGRWLLPGLGEMHAHVPPDREAAERTLFLYLSQGVTTARGMLGQPAHLELREALARDEVLGPRLYTTGPSLNGQSIPNPDSAARAVRHQAGMGYDLLKIHPGLTRASYDAIARTAEEVGIEWAGHVPADVGLARALETGQASIDHLDQYMEAIVADGTSTDPSFFFGLNLAGFVEEEKIAEVARATAEAGVWNVPTQSLIENMGLPTPPEELAALPSMRYMPPATVEGWVSQKRQILEATLYSPEAARLAVDVRRRLIKALHDAGAGLLLGSDAPQVFQVPGFSIHQELEILVESGLTPYEALRAGTYNVADYFDALDEFGTVEVGRVADLLLVEGNPLEDVRNVANLAGVMVRGRWVPATEIDERLEAIAASYR